MNERDLRSLLRAGDPAAHDETPSPGQLANMRRQVLHAARTPDVARTPWHQPLAVAAAVALTVAAGIFAGQHFPRQEAATPSSGAPSPASDARRQLQFSTPGGTRIIWVFDPDFPLKETVP